VEKQVLIIWAAGEKYLDDVPVEDCTRFERELYPFVEANYPNVLKSIREKKQLDDAVKADAKTALDAFKERFVASSSASGAAAAD